MEISKSAREFATPKDGSCTDRDFQCVANCDDVEYCVRLARRFDEAVGDMGAEIDQLRESVVELAQMVTAADNNRDDLEYHLNQIGYERCLYCAEGDMNFVEQFYPRAEMTPVEDVGLGCGMLCPACAREIEDDGEDAEK